ncbi:ceramide synthase 2-like [Arapaima gigas]
MLLLPTEVQQLNTQFGEHQGPFFSSCFSTMFQTMYDWFWWDRLWLPVNLTWSDLEDKDGRVYARVSHLYVTVPYSIVFLIVRYLFERFVATPVAASFGIGDKIRQKAPDNVILEKYFCSYSRNPTQLDIDGLSKKCNWTRRQVERWFRKRRNQDRPGLLKKFREARCVIYANSVFNLTIVSEGLFPVLLQTMLESQYWYYIIEMSFYVSLLFSITFDVKRKASLKQIIHHLATLVLLAFSWCVNYIRIGTLVMIIHDTSDVLLESAKLFNYAKWEKTCNTLFVVFAIVFMVTRLVIFPFWLIHCTWVYPVELYPAFFGYYFFNVMLVVLLFLHIFWAYLILRMVKKFLFGNVSSSLFLE